MDQIPFLVFDYLKPRYISCALFLSQSVAVFFFQSLMTPVFQATPVIQQRGTKNIAGRIIAPTNLKTTSLMNSMQPVNVTATGSIQIGNNMHNLSAVQSLLNSGNAQTATGIRVKTNNRRNVSVAGLQSLAVSNSNGQSVGETQTINCAKLQTIGTSQATMNTSTNLSAGELQTLAGTLTAAPTIGTIQLTRNVQTLPAASVHLVTNNNTPTINSVNKTATLNSIQLNTTDGIVAGKTQKIMRLANSQDANAQTSLGVQVSALSALLSGMVSVLV